jgi:hypothetical protein
MSEAAATKLVRQPATANEVSHVVITAAMKVHSALGPGCLKAPMKHVWRMNLRKLD